MSRKTILSLCLFGGLVLAFAALPVASASVIDADRTCSGPVDGNCYRHFDGQFCWLYLGDDVAPSACVYEGPPSPTLGDDICDLLPPHVCGP